MNIVNYFPFFTTLISSFFFISVLEQYKRRHKPHQLAWAIAMLLFMVTAGAEALAIVMGEWVPWVYKLYYVLAAIQVTFMGGGVLYLFDSRNVVHERNSWKSLLIFSSVWALFAGIFTFRSPVFYLILIPSIFMILMSVLYLIISKTENKKKQKTIRLCISCRNEESNSIENCGVCGKDTIEYVAETGKFTSWWHRNVTGRFISHLFIIFTLFIFFLMNIFAWTSPLNLEMLKNSGEVSGLPWQADPNDPIEARATVRLFSPLHTVPGAIALIGGGFYSYITWQLSIRKNTGKFNFPVGRFNVWIALGALVLGQGAFFSGFGLGTLYISESISVSMMYWGFLGSDKTSKEKFLRLIYFKEPTKLSA